VEALAAKDWLSTMELEDEEVIFLSLVKKSYL